MSYKIIRGPESHAGERHRAGPQRGGEGPLTRPETPHASTPLLNCCWSSLGVTSKRSAVTRKGSYLPTPPFHPVCGRQILLPRFQPNQPSEHKSRRGKPAVSYEARRSRDLRKCKKRHASHRICFHFGKYFYLI